MAEYLANTCQIDVITAFPYYPEWEIREEYQNKSRFLKEKKGNINIYRYKQYVPKTPTFVKRIIHLLDFTLGSFRNIRRIKKCDLVICIVPFTTSIFLGLYLAKRKGAKVWVHIQDFEFDAAVESGLAGKNSGSKSKIFDRLFRMEGRWLNKADIVSTISYGMISKLKTKTTTPTYFFPNWVDENFINPENAKRHPFLLSQKFKILYSGNIGAKQDWAFFLSIVEQLEDHKDIEFIIVGAGAKKEWLVDKTKQYDNVIHYMPIEYSALPDLLCSTNLHFLFQKNDVVDTVMPSKLLGMMASGIPSVVTGNLDSEVAKVFKKSKGGYFFDSNDLNSAIQAIKKLQSSPSLLKELGNNSRKYITENFTYSKVLRNFEKKIKETLSQ